MSVELVNAIKIADIEIMIALRQFNVGVRVSSRKRHVKHRILSIHAYCGDSVALTDNITFIHANRCKYANPGACDCDQPMGLDQALWRLIGVCIVCDYQQQGFEPIGDARGITDRSAVY